jgi:hypothetical protein
VSKPVLDPSLESALVGGCPGELPWQAVRVEEREIGILAVPSGRIVACDPFLLWKPVALALETPTGSFPVRLFIIHYEDGDQRIAAARLEFTGGAPDRWEMAVMHGQDVSTLEADHIFGYAVDSGTGSFMDLKAAKQLETHMGADQHYFEEVIEQMDQTYVHTRSWAMIDVGNADGLNAAVFSSGVGDGFYASYWGWSGGRLMCLVTDFGLLYSESDREGAGPRGTVGDE